MEQLPYLDIHSHLRTPPEDSKTVSCLSFKELQEGNPSGDFVTAGIHPWWLEDHDLNVIESLKAPIEALALSGKLWGIGESGLDRMYPEFLDTQRELFKWHQDLAEKYSLPLIIHNVRAGSDFLEILKERKAQTPWIFHDFRGNEELMKDLLRLHPDTYFSFGLSLDNSPQIRELFPLVPLDRLFLETDDQKHLDIHDIYVRAADRLQVDMDFLKSQIWHNFKKMTMRVVT